MSDLTLYVFYFCQGVLFLALKLGLALLPFLALLLLGILVAYAIKKALARKGGA
jgi:hypothetical protein